MLADWEQPSIEVSYLEQLDAPVAKGEVVGSVTYYIDSVEYASCFIRTVEEVPEIDFWYCLRYVITKWNSGVQ